MNPQAAQLNKIIKTGNPAIHDLLSKKGKAVFMPKEGILVQSAEAEGASINATIGQAIGDNGQPLHLASMAKLAKLDPKEIFLYSQFSGKPELRKAWLKKILKENQSLRTKTSLPVVTSGITHGLSIIGFLFADPGDEIIIADKYWPNYRAIFETAYGARLKTFNTFVGEELDLDAFAKALAGRKDTKTIILLTLPGNPAGYMPTAREATTIVKIIHFLAEQNNKILVICDDAYAGLIYDKKTRQESIFPQFANLHQNILAAKLDGASKEYYGWGLRVGFVTFGSKNISQEVCQTLEEKTAAVIRATISNVAHISQSLLLKALKSPTAAKEKNKNYRILKKRFEIAKTLLKNREFEKVFRPLPTNSGYFICLELKPGINPEQLRKTLIEKYDTGVITTQNMLRVAFSSVPEKHIKQLLENIYDAAMEQPDNRSR